mmetsp:Transcript_94415/g.237005  ORF Transcript_94415/g.237005 Transcript_94415/m.237005 type:complete len:135 (-) Transcript_94415:91-495(-)
MAVAAVLGAEQMAQLPVGNRVNFQLFREAKVGTSLRIGGRFASTGLLTATDGGAVSVLPGEGLDVSTDALATSAAFIEVVGVKEADGVIRAAGVVPLPAGDVDTELWDEAVKLLHLPQLRHMFAPATDVEVAMM